jgi:hypothetical protein
MKWLLLILVLMGCGPGVEETFLVTFYSESDPGRALAGVRITIDGAPVGASRTDGMLEASLTARPGARVALGATCPEGYQGARLPTTLTLRRVRGLASGSAGAIRVPISCPPSHRTAAIVVRAAGQANLPIIMNGREVGRTDKNGVAHLIFRTQEYRSLRVTLDTRERPQLMPQDPELSFQINDKDEIFIFDQPFVEKQDSRKPGRKSGPKRTRPVRIG